MRGSFTFIFVFSLLCFLLFTLSLLRFFFFSFFHVIGLQGVCWLCP